MLKPGGVYAFTTVVTFGKDSERIPHNHYFHPEHLMALADRSPLYPNPVFDCTVRHHYYNRPLTERSQDFGFPAANLLIHPLVSLRRGVITAANLVVLTRRSGEKNKTRIVGFDGSAARLKREADAFTRTLWERPQNIAVEKARKSEAASN